MFYDPLLVGWLERLEREIDCLLSELVLSHEVK